jgi:succinoglycan biosynthesis transport protein ExoP
MLQVTKGSPFPSSNESVGPKGVSLGETFLSFVGAVRRHLTIFIAIVACSVVLGLLYLFTTPSSYTASTTMVIDTRKVQLFQQQALAQDAVVDSGMVQTEVEILKSQNISLAVIKDLHLAEDPEFTGSGSGLLGAVFGTIASLFGEEPASETLLQRRALGVFEAHRFINRVGLTYIMEISFRSYDAEKAARIANAIADAYVVDQLDAKYQATRRASVWLQDRIKELRTEASAAEQAVVDFKQNNNIVDTGGRLMNEQQLAEVNSQLILAHATTAEAKARLDNINEIMKQAIPDGSVADALKSEVIIKLRSQYLEISSQEALWSAKYGPNHLATINLRNKMQEIRRNISDEMNKIAESYKSDYEIALARENAMKSSLDSTVSASQVTNQAQIQLRELESNAQTYRVMYDNFLQRYMEAVQQQSFPITEARVISAASRPLHRSQPNTMIVLAASLVGGLMLSSAVVFYREMADQVFRTSSQVENSLQVNCLAMVPIARLAQDAPVQAPEASLSASRAKPSALRASRQDIGSDNWIKQKAPAAPREIARTPSLLRYVVEAPFSQFTEALRSVKVSIDLNGGVQTNKVIGITSSLPTEGKSTISANLSALIAHAGARAILVDADLRNPSLSRHLAPGAELGLVDVLAGRADLDSVLWHDPESGLTFLPVGSASKLMHTHEILGLDSTKKFFGDLRASYDYVIADFAPLAPVVDTRTSVNFVDSYLFVVEWGRTKIDIVEHSLSGAVEIYDRLLGVVLNKADMNVLGRYEQHRSNYYYKKYYSRYGYTA